VKTDAIADEARRRSDDAVRRLREESGYRVERERRHRAFFSWCALATLASGISLAAFDATPDDIDPPLPPVADSPHGPTADQVEADIRRAEAAACYQVEVDRARGGFRKYKVCPGGRF
jgi:hypothetical protein